MTENEKQQDFIAKAEEADAMAEKAASAQVRDTWRKIARNYRTLAGIPEKEAR